MATLAAAPARLAGSAVLACQSDERLAEMVRDGHERAFDVLVERYRRPLIRYCGRILPASRSEDAVQQTFINAHAALSRGDEPEDVKRWLYRIAHNASLNMLRQNGWNYDPIPLDLDGVRRPDQLVEQRIELQQTVAAVNELPERQRTALVMRELEGRSYTEIAAVLGAGDGAVRQLLNRARVTLRTAVTALTPPPVLARIAAASPRDGRGVTRFAEAFTGVGAAGAAKIGATALVAGSLVVGAVNSQLPLVGHSSSVHQRAAAATHSGAVAASAGGTTVSSESVADHGAATHRGSRNEGATSHRHGSQNANGHRNGSRGEHSSGRNENPSGARNGDDHSGTRAPTSGGDHSGSGDRSGSDDHSVSGTSGSGDTGSVTSGGGSNDGLTTTSGGSDDLTSGSGTSGSDGGTSGSGSGTSGSGDSTTTTSDSSTSGTDTSGTSTSGSDSLSSGTGSGSTDSTSSGSASGSGDTIAH